MKIIEVNLLVLYKYYYQDILFEKIVDKFNALALNKLNEEIEVHFILMFSYFPFQEELSDEEIASNWKGVHLLSIDEKYISEVYDSISDKLDDSIKHQVKQESEAFYSAINKDFQRNTCIKNNLMSPDFYRLFVTNRTKFINNQLWIDEVMVEIPFPVCFKLPDSNGSDCFRVLYNHSELNQHLEITKEISHQKNKKPIESFILESYVKGEEYVIDFIICNSSIIPVGHWKYVLGEREGTSTSIRGAISLDSIDKTIIDKFKSLFAAMGLSHGFTHNEYRIDQDGNIVLMEVNPRLSGCDFIYVYLKKYDVDFISLLAYSYAKIDAPEYLVDKFFKKPNKLYYIHWAQQYNSNNELDLIKNKSVLNSLVYIPHDIYETVNAVADGINLDLAISLCGSLYPSFDEWVSYCPYCVHFSSDLPFDEFSKQMIKKIEQIESLIKIK